MNGGGNERRRGRYGPRSQLCFLEVAPKEDLLGFGTFGEQVMSGFWGAGAQLTPDRK